MKLTVEKIEELFQKAAGADEDTHIRFARAIEAAVLAQFEPVGINGLTEAETAATASVMGIVAPEAKQEPTCKQDLQVPTVKDSLTVQEPRLPEFFCGVDVDGNTVSVSVLRRRPDDVAEVIHSEQVQLHPAPEVKQDPVEFLWENGELHLDGNPLLHTTPLYTHPAPVNTALLDACEGVAWMAKCGYLDAFIGEPWLNEIHAAIAQAEKEMK